MAPPPLKSCTCNAVARCDIPMVLRCLGLCGLIGVASFVQADGMIPETSVVIVYEGEAEAAVKVTNSDDRPGLLHVTLKHVPEDNAPLLVVTPPIARVEAGQVQLVRFILTGQAPLKTQRLKRVIFEGLTQTPSPVPGEANVSVNVRQNLPVILHPTGLAKNPEPWKGLHWGLADDGLYVSNPTPYVVRLAQQVYSLPSETPLMLPRSYLLPGDRVMLHAPAGPGPADNAVRLAPATTYGFAVAPYQAPLHRGSP